MKRKIPAFLTAACLTLSTAALLPEEALDDAGTVRTSASLESYETELIPVFRIGDVDDNGSVDMTDYAILQRYLSSWDVNINEAAADIDGNKTVDMTDYALLQRHLSGWDVEFFK